MIVECEICRKMFNRKPSEILKHIYCSKQCRKIAMEQDKKLNGRYSGGKLVPCVICNKETYRTPSQIKNSNGHPTCSMVCLGAWRSKNLIGNKAANFKGMLKKIVCKVCKKEFGAYHKNPIYCSRKCMHIGMIKQETRTCQNCDNQFNRARSSFIWHQKRGHTKVFCSTKCRIEYMKGINSGNWIEDRSKLKNRKKSFRALMAMKEWRKSVFTRDNYICRICKDKSKKGHAVVLNAHHIIPIKQDEGLAFDINNGITLCEKCHKKTYQKESELSTVFLEILNRGVHDGKINFKRAADFEAV